MTMNYELFENMYHENKKKVYLVDMTQEQSGFLSELAKKSLDTYIESGKKIAIIINKKGYASGILCQDCGHAPMCNHCDVPISYHKLPNTDEMVGLCHICKTQYPSYHKCDKCHSKNIKDYGI